MTPQSGKVKIILRFYARLCYIVKVNMLQGDFEMKTIDEFCGQKNGYSRSITLRNRLIPVGKTQENLEKANMLEEDFAI